MTNIKLTLSEVLNYDDKLIAILILCLEQTDPELAAKLEAAISSYARGKLIALRKVLKIAEGE
jgi:hypothetical protein